MKVFTKLMAAFALLAFLAVPMGMRGQTRAEVTLQYSGSTTTNMTGGNDAATLGLDADSWSVVGYKGGGGNYPGLNKDGTIRLYAASGNGSYIVVENTDGIAITSISVNLKQGTPTVLVDSEEVTGNSNVYEINSTSFTVANHMQSGQVQMNSITITYGAASSVATPTFDPAGGTFNAAQTVTISCETPDVTIYYTTDGSTPNDESTEYTAPITIEETTTLKAIAYDAEDNASNVATATYTITLPSVATPTFDPAGGTYNEMQTVTITCATEGATIYYTLDGTDPTTSSAEYSEALTIDETTTVKAMAAKENMSNSEIASAVYIINLPYTSDNYVRISSLDELTDGDRVIIAARHNSTVNAYYAMTATASGKPTGVAFTSTTSSDGEALPTEILDNENTYYWTVNVTTDGYTFTNASNAVLGYSSGTNFATGGNNTAWTIARNTSGNTAMVAGYEGFYIINKNNTGRGIALNSQHNFGPYAVSNNNSNDYNFYLDFFVQGAEATITPSISAENVNILYDATSGSIAYTINNGVEGGVLTASTESDWLTLGTVGETVPFTCTANEVNSERTATVTLTYTYGDNQAITKDVTVTQAGDPNAVNNISDITEVGANYQVKGMVVATNAKGFIIGDGTGYVYTYLNNSSISNYAVGDNLFISGTTGSYGHVIQFTNTATINTVEETNYNGDPQPTVITEVPDYSEGYHLSTYLQFEGNLTKTGNNYQVAIGESKIRISYPTTDQDSVLTALLNKTVRVHGFFTGISGTNGNSVFTAMMESVEDITPVVPSVTVTPSEINAPYTETDGTLAITYENIPELISFDYYFCNAEGTELEDTDPNYPDWIDAEIQEDTLYYLIGENDGEARTTYLKVYTYDEELEEVYAIVTVNQAAVEAPNVTWDLSAASYVQSEDPVAPTSELITWTSDFATMTNEKGQGSTGVNNFIPPTQTSTRFYKNNVLTITPTSGYAITSVVFTATTAGYAGALKNSTWVNATASVEDKIVTVTPTDGCSEIIATMGGTCGFTAVTVYYVPDTVPAITVSPATLNVDAQPHLVNYLSLTYKNIVADSANSFTVHYYDAEGVEYEPVPGEVWMYAQMVGSANAYQVFCTILANQGEARTAYFKVSCGETYSNLVTVNQEAAPQQYTLTVDSFENLELITFVNDSMVMEAAGQIQVTEGAQIMLSIVALEGYEMETLMVNGVNHVDDIADDFTYSFVMPSEDVTISATALEVVPFAPALYTKVTSIVPGQRYIIVGFTGIDAYAMGGQTNNNRAAIVISEDRNTAVVTNESVAEFVIGSSGDFFTINDGTGYLYAASSNNNYLRTETVLDNNGKWAITIAEDGQADVVAQGSNSRKYMRYNVTSTVFSCYAENSNVKDKVYFYVKSSEAPTADNVVVEGTDFGTIENPTNAGYRLIASPVNNVNPAAVEGMTSGNYDLYAYNANEDDEWINHKTAKFHLVSGRGYLYAKDTVVNLNFVGQPITDFEGVELDYAEGDALKSLTLVGNPFFYEASFVVANNGTNADFNYLTLNSDGDGFVVGNTNGSQAKTLAPMEAMFVQAPEANYMFLCGNCMGGEPGIPDSNHGLLNLKVTRNRGQVIDNALVSFGNAPMMNKLMLNEKATKVYVPVGGKEMAVVRVQAEGEMPVNFKAENDGTYTLSVNAENVEMNYLHLVDNMTGADVDLLATPNYTFEAKTSDYESRFRLVFASISEDAEGNHETFAYFNGSEWVVSNIGESTLQVVDVMGRVLSSETVSGNATVSISQMPGVYMLRLVNGNQVKVQKVVVR